MPFQAEVALRALLGVGGDDGDEERARSDFFANLPIPGVASDQFALVEPHLDARRAKRSRNTLRCRDVFGRVGEENGLIRCAHYWGLTISDLRITICSDNRGRQPSCCSPSGIRKRISEMTKTAWLESNMLRGERQIFDFEKTENVRVIAPFLQARIEFQPTRQGVAHIGSVGFAGL